MAIMEEDEFLLLTDEEGNETPFLFLDVVEYEGEEYVVLLPAEGDGSEVNIFLIQPLSDGEEQYVPIEDDAVLQAVFALFQKNFFTED